MKTNKQVYIRAIWLCFLAFTKALEFKRYPGKRAEATLTTEISIERANDVVKCAVHCQGETASCDGFQVLENRCLLLEATHSLEYSSDDLLYMKPCKLELLLYCRICVHI